MKSIIVEKLNKKFEVNIDLPGSKSITLRDYVLASLADGVSVISQGVACKDAERMKESLERLGVVFEDDNNQGFKVHGLGGKFLPGEKNIWLGASGTSMRLLSAVAILRKDKTIFDGDKSLRARPQKYLLDCLASLGATVNSREDGYLPVEIYGAEVNRNTVSMKGDTSSQYFSALMQIAPLLPQGLEIKVEGDLVSKPYIDITINEMNKFGAEVENNKYQSFKIKPQIYKPANLTVEGDASAASYFMALATIHGGKVTFKNLGKNSKQGDINFYKICEQLGAKVELKENELIIVGASDKKLNSLEGEINMEDIPDTAQTLMAIAPLLPGRTKIIGLATLKLKECDRISAPATELRKLGVKVEEGNDYIVIYEKTDWDWEVIKNTSIDTYDDHRMAMSFAVLGTALGDLKINDPDCVSKTFKDYWEKLKMLY